MWKEEEKKNEDFKIHIYKRGSIEKKRKVQSK